MNRKMKSVGMWLLLGSLSTGMAYADLSKNESEIDIVQQTGICQGIVKDATGESVIGASVIVKGTTNGTITDIFIFEFEKIYSYTKYRNMCNLINQSNTESIENNQ